MTAHPSHKLSLGIIIVLLAGALFTMLATRGDSVRIEQVLADPARFESIPVTVSGKVDRIVSFSFAPAFEYRITDRTGSIAVISDSSPRDGTRLKVTGDLHRISFLGLSSRPVLRETRRTSTLWAW